MKALVLTLFLFAMLAPSAPAPEISGCTAKGIRLYGRVNVVTSFADLKVQVVNSFPDLKVQKVNSFPSSCGKWQFVDSFPDFTIQYVQSFPDIAELLLFGKGGHGFCVKGMLEMTVEKWPVLFLDWMNGLK